MSQTTTPSRSGWSRRSWLGAGLALGFATPAFAADVVLPVPQSLRDELNRALHGGNPLVVMVSLDGCAFCKQARNSYLGPLRSEQGVPVVQVNMRSAMALQDFRGAASTHERLVQQWQVRIAPTLLFLGHEGQEVAPRLVGAGLPDFYGAYLDERLVLARKALQPK